MANGRNDNTDSLAAEETHFLGTLGQGVGPSGHKGDDPLGDASNWVALPLHEQAYWRAHAPLVLVHIVPRHLQHRVGILGPSGSKVAKSCSIPCFGMYRTHARIGFPAVPATETSVGFRLWGKVIDSLV